MHCFNSFRSDISFKSTGDIINPAKKDGDINDMSSEELIKQREAILSANPFAQNENGEYLFFKLIDTNSVPLIRLLLGKKHIRDQLLSLVDKDGNGALEHAQNEELRSLLISRGAKKLNGSDNYEDARIISARMLVGKSNNVGNLSPVKEEKLTQEQEQTGSFFDAFTEDTTPEAPQAQKQDGEAGSLKGSAFDHTEKSL